MTRRRASLRRLTRNRVAYRALPPTRAGMQVAVGALSSAKAGGAGLPVNAFGAVSLSVQGLFLAAGDLPGELPGGGGGGVSGVCSASFCSSRCLRALAS